VFIRTQTTAGRTYLLLVENERVEGRIKQRVLLRLGRLDQLQASGQLDSLLLSLGRFSDKLAVLDAHARGDSVTTHTRSIGCEVKFHTKRHRAVVPGLPDRSSLLRRRSNPRSC
jgi:hypothetical protein